MSFSLEQVVNILLDIGIDNVNDLTNIIYLYQQYGIQVNDTYFKEDVEFLIIENTLQIKDMYKVDINKPVEADVLNVIRSEFKDVGKEVIKIAILGGVLYIPNRGKMYQQLLDAKEDEVIISALLLRDFLYSL